MASEVSAMKEEVSGYSMTYYLLLWPFTLPQDQEERNELPVDLPVPWESLSAPGFGELSRFFTTFGKLRGK
jgi:hypothetical protein